MILNLVSGTVVTYACTKNKEEAFFVLTSICSMGFRYSLYRLYHVDLLDYLDLQILPEQARIQGSGFVGMVIHHIARDIAFYR